MKFHFQELQSVDQALVDQIVAIEREAFGDGGMNAWFIAPFIRHGRVYVLRDQERVVAIAEYMRDFLEPTTAYLFGLSVLSSYQGRTLGYQIVDQAHKRLVDYGITHISLTVAPDNQRARKLYQEKLHFKQCQFLENEYGPGIHRLYLRLALSRF